MSVSKLNPYICLNGHAAKAIAFYQEALGAKVEDLRRFDAMPSEHVKPEFKDRVMHAVLRIDAGVLMLSDSMPDMPVRVGGNVDVCLNFDDLADAKKKFAALSVGGKVTMPFSEAFWGAHFGQLTDAYGIQWMFNCERKAG